MQHKIIDIEDVVIRFAGDSGDGMQLTGTLFADSSALFGNEISTFPDYPVPRRLWPMPNGPSPRRPLFSMRTLLTRRVSRRPASRP